MPGSKTTKKSYSNKKQDPAIKRLMKKTISNTAAAIVSTDNKIAALKRRVTLQQEYRYKDINIDTTVNELGTMNLLNGLGIGDNQFNQREGAYALMKQVRIKLSIIGADAHNLVRVILFIAKEPKGVTPFYGDLLDVTGIPATLAYRKDSNNENFTVLYDKTFPLVLDTETGARFIRINKRLNLKTNYGLGITGNIADISYGAIYLYLVSDSAATSHPHVYGSVRIRFTA